MIVSSPAGYGVLSVDPALSAKSTENVDRPASQTPPPPPSVTTSQSVISFQPDSLLSSGAIAEVLKLTDAASPGSSIAEKPKTIDRQAVLDAVKRSKAYAAGDAASANRVGEIYTSKDVAFIRATTGYNVISIGKLTAIVDDDGNPPFAETLNDVDQMASAIEMARSFGGLTGEITPEHAKEMLGYHAGLNAFPQDWLDNALKYLGSQADSRPAEV